METAVQQIFKRLKEIGAFKRTINKEELEKNFKIAMDIERKQIIDAMDEGIKYGNSDMQTFDYPSSRYYSVTYPNTSK